jgi:hypothetical protein
LRRRRGGLCFTCALPGVVEDVAVDGRAIYIAGHGSGTIWKLAK